MSSQPVVLITSGAYVDQEIAAEFGRMPPAFLPIGSKRLYELQREVLGEPTTLYLSIPERFHPTEADNEALERLGITLIAVPESLSLAESVLFALNSIDYHITSLKILHGDTLIQDIPSTVDDAFSVTNANVGYKWADVFSRDGLVESVEMPADDQRRSSEVASGYFSFSRINVLLKALTQARGHFATALTSYARSVPVQLLRVDQWYDFGHLQTFYESRRKITTARWFNNIQVKDHCVLKSSEDELKLRAEAAWFQSVPVKIKPYTARFIGTESVEHKFGYMTEFEQSPSLAELLVFGVLQQSAWTRIISCCIEFLDACSSFSAPRDMPEPLDRLVQAKTFERLEAFGKQSRFELDAPLSINGFPVPSLRSIAREMVEQISKEGQEFRCVMHGDFCFSNILYDARKQRIRVIDPRGHLDGIQTIYGDQRYDLAKLIHSAIGGYDSIIFGRFKCTWRDNYSAELTFADSHITSWLASELSALDTKLCKVRTRASNAIMVTLFLSMLPLHRDRPDRQMAFIANALRLYLEHKEIYP